jgi:hypothetical protein
VLGWVGRCDIAVWRTKERAQEFQTKQWKCIIGNTSTLREDSERVFNQRWIAQGDWCIKSNTAIRYVGNSQLIELANIVAEVKLEKWKLTAIWLESV